MQIFFVQQAFDNCCARRRRAEPFFFHRGAQLFIVDRLAGAFHRRQQRCFRIPSGRLGGIGFHLNCFGLDLFAGLYRRQIGCRSFIVNVAAINGEPSRVYEHFALGFECLGFDTRDPRGLQKFRGGIEHGEKAFHDEIVKFCFDFVQGFWCLRGRDDREVV